MTAASVVDAPPWTRACPDRHSVAALAIVLVVVVLVVVVVVLVVVWQLGLPRTS